MHAGMHAARGEFPEGLLCGPGLGLRSRQDWMASFWAGCDRPVTDAPEPADHYRAPLTKTVVAMVQAHFSPRRRSPSPKAVAERGSPLASRSNILTSAGRQALLPQQGLKKGGNQ
jgi:hypothetical protein